MRDLYPSLEALLRLVQEGFAALGVDLPARQYVAPGAIAAYDDEQLTVNLGRVYLGRPGAEDPLIRLNVFSADLSVTILRKSAMMGARGSAPLPEDEQAVAQVQMKDMQTLAEVLGTVRTGYTYTDLGTPFAINPVLPYGPEGGLVGSVGSISIQAV